MGDEIDTEVSGAETIDTSTGIQSTDTSTEIPGDGIEIQPGQAEKDHAQTVTPFAGGKEKFKVAGQEVEWDWPTTQRYAQMGFSAQQKFEQAATIEKKAKETFSQLVHAAQADPEGLIKLLNPGFTGFKTATQKKGAGEAEDAGEGNGPNAELVAYVKKLESRLGQFEEGFEKQAIAEERQAIEKELDAAVKAYPVLGNKIYRDYVKQQYAAALKKNMDVALDDVAFHVANEIQMQRQAEERTKKEKLEANRKKAPVGAVHGVSGKKEPMSLEDVMRLAGRM